MTSGQLLGGIALGLVLGAGGMFAISTYVLSDAADCGGICGEGTVCTAGRCELAPPDDAPIVEDTPVDEPASKRKRKKGKRGSGADDDAGELAAGSGPPVDNDGKVPRFDANADQTIGMSDGTGRLSDAVIDRELAKLDGAFQACVRDAAARVDELGRGTVKYSFGVDGRGRVTGVNASAPNNLTDAGIVPCVRLAVHGHKFPAFDGPTMKVSSSFTVD